MTDGDEVLDKISRMPHTQALVFLACLAHAITVAMRDSYDMNGEGLADCSRVRPLNEVMHSVNGALLALLRDEGYEYDLGKLARAILQPRRDQGLACLLAFCIRRAVGVAFTEESGDTAQL